MILDSRKKLISGVFLFIFLGKMIISIAPLIINFTDRDHIRAVILQLEIENNAKENDISKDKAGKEFWGTNVSPFSLSDPLLHFFLMPSVEEHRDIECYYPSVPTPPPNV